jgi:hypothetical protein
MTDKGKPESGKVYRLTGGPDVASIAGGSTWAESEVRDEEAEYKSQAARDAQLIGYGDEGYWNYLDEAALDRAGKDAAKGDLDSAQYELTRSLAEALRGNDGE